MIIFLSCPDEDNYIDDKDKIFFYQKREPSAHSVHKSSVEIKRGSELKVTVVEQTSVSNLQKNWKINTATIIKDNFRIIEFQCRANQVPLVDII